MHVSIHQCTRASYRRCSLQNPRLIALSRNPPRQKAQRNDNETTDR